MNRLPALLPVKKVLVGDVKEYHVFVVGVGGTGSFVALNTCRMIASEIRQNPNVSIWLTLVDPDTVEEKNIGRQYFAYADIGKPKARVLAERMSQAFGLVVEACVTPFSIDVLKTHYEAHEFSTHENKQCVIIGCVDNPAARRDIHDALEKVANLNYPHEVDSFYRSPHGIVRKLSRRCEFWWLDAGNSHHSGQVHLGNSLVERPQEDEFGNVFTLPLPSVQSPELLEDDIPVADDLSDDLSCADLVRAGTQSRSINYQMAAIVDLYLEKLLSNSLTFMATHLSQDGMVMASKPVENAVKVRMPGVAPLRSNPVHQDELTIMPCPMCGDLLIVGEDTIDEEDVEIMFCGQGHYSIVLAEYTARLEEVNGDTEMITVDWMLSANIVG